MIVDKAITTIESNAPDTKHPGGRPALFATPEALQSKWEEYLAQFPKDDSGKFKDKFPRVTEAIWYLGFNSRQAFYQQEERGPEFLDIIKKIRLYCQMILEEKLFSEKSNPTKWIYGLNATGYPKDHFKEKSRRIGGNVNIILTNKKPDLTITTDYEILPDEN